MSELEEGTPIPLVLKRKRDGRCVYSAEGRKALVELALQPGKSVAKLARQHDMNANVLRKWIVSAQEKGIPARRRPDPGHLVPVKLTEPPTRAKPARSAADHPLIEIEVDGATIRVHGLVDAAQLGVVLDCARRR
jgi:transposase-like protein